ncbi:MAG: sialidase family protein [Planctomycetota bacterium]
MSSDYSFPIQVLNPRKLPLWRLPAERVRVGIPGDYKPSLALLPDGELVMVALYMETRPDGSFHEWTPIWRSRDGGRTWSKREVLRDVIGREQWLTATSEGTLFMSCHFLPKDLANKDGITHSYLHRSTDRGRSWERRKVFFTGKARRGVPMSRGGGMTSRNVVETTDGTLLFGVCLNFAKLAWLWSSRDGGKSWRKGRPVTIGAYNGKPYDNADGFFTEDFTYLARSGKLLHWIRCGPPSTMYPMTDGRVVPTTDDQGDRTLMCESTDGGRTWEKLRDFGDYGMMYIRALRLSDGRLLLTYTQRSTFWPIGLRAALSYDDGETWDLKNDVFIIEGKTPWMKTSGGGFGNTVELADRTLVSAYTYRGEDDRTHLEVVRWRLPIAEARPYFFDRGILEMKDRRKLTVLSDWSGRGGAQVLPYDICQRDSGKPQARITRGHRSAGGETFSARVQFLSAAQSGDPTTGLSFVGLSVKDWSGALAVAMRVHNPTSRAQEIAIWVWDEDAHGPVRKQTFAPGETGTLFLARDEMESEVDLTRMRAVVLLALEPQEARTFLAGPLCLVRR